MDRTPVQVLFIEDSGVDVELALRSHGCEQGHGYLFSAAVPPEAMMNFLAAGSLKLPAAKFN
jgi:EAL domain-containing protein (putative c-di-GMP-specific phosphodiesterase class I)